MTRPDAIVAANHYIKRAPPYTDGDSFERLVSLRTAIEAGVPRGGLVADDARGMLHAVENGYDGVTAHSIVIDTANREIQLFVAGSESLPAPQTEPYRIDMDVLFGGLP